MGKYINVPNFVRFNDVVNKNHTLSSAQFVSLNMPNDCYKYVSDFLSRPLRRKDLGCEVGSLSYIDYSPYTFIRTKALQSHSFLPDFNKETAIPILPSEFIQMNLEKGDIIISKDSNIGETVILDKDYPNYMLSGALYKLPVKEEWRYYLFSLLKHDIFREQLDAMVPKGATIRHAKTLFLDCKIPLPKRNSENVIRFISLLTQAIIAKESLIRERFETILYLIENELVWNQKFDNYVYHYPTYNDVDAIGRIDTNMFNSYFKKEIFNIINYQNGYKNISQLGFNLSRGQNLQISNIGKSIYSDEWHDGFYTLILPMFLSKYGTVDEVKYLGNKNKLKTLKKGDLIFGAEGFEKGRSIVVIEEQMNAITNIHGITLNQKEHNLRKAIFVKCFLDYLRNKGLVDMFAVGGNGGSLAQRYWSLIPFPNFPNEMIDKIVKLYYNGGDYNFTSLSLSDFKEKDNEYNKKAGIYELDKTLKHFKSILNYSIDCIANDNDVDIAF